MALVALLALPSRAVVVAEPPPLLTIALSRSTSAPGDKQVEQRLAAALEATGRLKVVRSASASYRGELEVSRAQGALELVLALSVRDGPIVARVRQVVPGASRLQVGVEALALRAVAALDEARRKAAAAASDDDADSVSGPAKPRRTDSKEAPADSPGRRADQDDRGRPAPVIEPIREPPPPPRAPPTGTVKAEDWSGQREQFSAPPPPNRLDFILGAEVGLGPWSADPAGLVAGSPTYDLAGYAPAFTSGVDKQWRPGWALHGGWKFLGYGSVELAVQLSTWANHGQANLIGGRISGYPLKALWPRAPFELGLELGAGHAFVASGAYDMSGAYLGFGVNGEYPLNRWLGAVLYYRLYLPLLSRFYVDYQNDRSEPVSFTAKWNTIGLGLNFHPSISW